MYPDNKCYDIVMKITDKSPWVIHSTWMHLSVAESQFDYFCEQWSTASWRLIENPHGKTIKSFDAAMSISTGTGKGVSSPDSSPLNAALIVKSKVNAQ